MTAENITKHWTISLATGFYSLGILAWYAPPLWHKAEE